jgi:hypothetical protein
VHFFIHSLYASLELCCYVHIQPACVPKGPHTKKLNKKEEKKNYGEGFLFSFVVVFGFSETDC